MSLNSAPRGTPAILRRCFENPDRNLPQAGQIRGDIPPREPTCSASIMTFLDLSKANRERWMSSLAASKFGRWGKRRFRPSSRRRRQRPGRRCFDIDPSASGHHPSPTVNSCNGPEKTSSSMRSVHEPVIDSIFARPRAAGVSASLLSRHKWWSPLA